MGVKYSLKGNFIQGTELKLIFLADRPQKILTNVSINCSSQFQSHLIFSKVNRYKMKIYLNSQCC